MGAGYRPGSRRWSDRERVAAGALVGGPRILHLQAAAEERRVHVEDGALDDRGAARVDQHADAVGSRDHVILCADRLVEPELVGEPGAPAGDDAQAKDGLGATVLGRELRDLARGGVRHGQGCGGGAHRNKDSPPRAGMPQRRPQPPRNEAKIRAYVRAPVTSSSTAIDSSAVWASERSPGPKITVGIAA